MTARKDNTAQPDRVTRFYGNPDYALETIASRQITFVHVSALNDPFDPYFFLEIEFGDSYQTLHEYIKENHPAKLSWFGHHVTPESWSQTIKKLKDKLKSFRAGTFVFSTSGLQDDAHPKDNLYMWGHYGNGHRGVAIEFDTDELRNADFAQAVKERGVNYDKLWVKMKYSEKFPPLSYEHFIEFFEQERDWHDSKIRTRKITKLEEYYDSMSKIKSDVWARENEWRLMWRNDETRMKIQKFSIPSGAIATIFLGLSVSEEVAADMLFESKQKIPQARVFRARKKVGEFALYFEQVG
jgi:hypothetical protein